MSDDRNAALGTGTGRTARLKVRRGQPGQPERFDEFNVPYTDGMSVLDGLIWVREHVDPTVAIRYSCTNANSCKECAARIDGKTGYLCTARLRQEGTLVEPVSVRTLVRDTVVEMK